MENADPAHTYALCAGREPQVLDSTHNRIDRSFRHGMSTQMMPALSLLIADHTEVLRGFQKSFQFEPRIHFVEMPTVAGRGGGIGALENSIHRRSQRKIAHHDKAPRLHKADRWSLVGRSEQSIQQCIIQWLWQVSDTYIAPLTKSAIDRGSLCRGKIVLGPFHPAFDHRAPLCCSSRRRETLSGPPSTKRPK